MKVIAVVGLLQAGFGHAHYAFSRLAVNGVDIGGDYDYIRPQSNGIIPVYTDPQQGFTSPFMRCNNYTGPSKTLTVAAGDKISFIIQQPDRQRLKLDHPGPGLIYMSRSEGDIATYDGSGNWFKVMESGLCSNGSVPNPKVDWCHWARDRLEFSIPKTIPPGEYLVRVEQLALQFAVVWGQVQVYGECAQLNITGPGGGNPGPLVKIPVVYHLSDPGFQYNLTADPPIALPYIMPGPQLWNGS